MKILIISTDGKILEKGSAVRSRMLDYGTICEELSIVVASLDGSRERIKIGHNVFVYPTASSNKFFSRLSMLSIGRKIKSDLVTVQDPFETGFLAWLISLKTGAKLELQVHTDFLNPFFTKQSFLNRFRVFLARFLLPRADGIRVVSERIKKSLGTWRLALGTTPAILPIYVDAKKIMETNPAFDLHEKYPQFKFIVFTAARLEKEKNISLALKAMSNVICRYSNVGFVISGAGREEKDLRLKTKNLKLETNVIFEGEVKDVISRYKTADLYLSTSDYEGYGLSLVEAALSGCPIVTTDVGIVGEILKDGISALVCPPGNADCLASNIARLITDPELRKKLKRAALAAILEAVEKDEYSDKIRLSWERALGINK